MQRSRKFVQTQAKRCRCDMETVVQSSFYVPCNYTAFRHTSLISRNSTGLIKLCLYYLLITRQIFVLVAIIVFKFVKLIRYSNRYYKPFYSNYASSILTDLAHKMRLLWDLKLIITYYYMSYSLSSINRLSNIEIMFQNVLVITENNAYNQTNKLVSITISI